MNNTKPSYLDKETTDGAKLNFDVLYQLFPSCFTEAKDVVTGEMRRVVDWSKLRSLLGEYVEDGEPEKYDFTWVGKRAAQREAAKPCRMTLRPSPEESVDWDTTQNLYIEGDNLEVLKLLQNSYMGKVKMIYIDPPYNTGNDFVYHDDYAQSAEEYDEHNRDDEGNRFRKNTDSNGRFHSDWCSMIYARLMVARSLLTEDGVIFISIDSRETTNLKKICDEVFGERNFIDIFNWAKTETPENLSKKSKQIIEYILCYQKIKDDSKFRGIRKEAVSSNGLLNQPNAYGILTFPADNVLTSISDGTITSGMYGTDTYDVELLEDTEVKAGCFVKPVKLRARFKWSQDYLDNEIKKGTIIKIPTMKFSPSYEKKEYAPEVPANLINSKVGVDTNENASAYQLQLFDKKVFNYPKPVSLIQYLIQFKDDNQEQPYIIMDFFSGSGTTAESCMKFNQSLGVSHCRFILVQLPEDLNEALANAKNPSEKEIIQNAIDFLEREKLPQNLCELAKERIRRAGNKIKTEHPEAKDLDIGFRVLKCDESNFKPVAFGPSSYKQEQLDMFLDNIKEERTGLDLLFDCMMRWGLELSLPYTTQQVDGCTIYNVDDGNLVACFEGKVTEATIDAIAQMHPLRVVFRDSSFAEAAEKMNLFELFKQKCGWSDQEVRNNVRVI
ncbi:MAG: site-specific DNA-methyltransferase [Bacteroidales bacterium]|nr:site-specific DNA-methyltransferase [Bacteroidales bacterium]